MTARSEVRIDRLEQGCKVTASNETRIRPGTWHVPIFRIMLTLTKGARGSLVRYWKNVGKELGDAPQFE